MSDNGECIAYLEQIVYYLDNELAETDIVEVRLHLDGCGPCHEQYAVQRAIKSLVARSCVERAPDELRDKVMFKIRDVEIRMTDC